MTTKLRRGFKSEAEGLAIELRTELELAAHDPIDIFALAHHLGIPTIPLSQLSEHVSEESLSYFVSSKPEAFSGTTVHRGPARLVLFNDAHTDARCRSTVAHELSHALLWHPPHVLANDLGERNRDAVMEEEANWLAGALLVPKAAAMRVVFHKIPVNVAAQHYMVSEQMMTYRLRVTGATRVATRYSAKVRRAC